MAPLVGRKVHEISYPLFFKHRNFLKKITATPRLRFVVPGHILHCSAPRAMSPSTSPVTEVKVGKACACAPIQCGHRKEGEAFALCPIEC
jgi:hypothetical protein